MYSEPMEGKRYAENFLYTFYKDDVEYLKANKIYPSLAIVTGGDDAGGVYVRSKQTACRKLGIECHIFKTTNMRFSDIMDLIENLNNDKFIHGIIVQLPLDPKKFTGMQQLQITRAIDPRKDVDGLTVERVGELHCGIGTDIASTIAPCTAKGIITLLDHYLYGSYEGKHTVILGRSMLVGRPLAEMLLQRDCTVTVCHSHTKNIMQHVSRADILVTAMGNPNIITDLPYGIEALVDVSMNRDEDGNLVGDIPKSLYNHFKLYTPVPGGVGPMTVAMLMENVIIAAYNQSGLLNDPRHTK